MALGAPERVTRIALYDAWVYEEQLPTIFLCRARHGVGETLFALFYDQRPDERIALAFYDKEPSPRSSSRTVEKALERPGTKAAALAAVRGQRFAESAGQYRTIDTARRSCSGAARTR